MTPEQQAICDALIQDATERAVDGCTRAEREFAARERAIRAERREAERKYQAERNRILGEMAELDALLWLHDHGHLLEYR